MRRHAVGVIALLMLGFGIGLWIWPPSGGGAAFAHGMCLKVGLVLGAVWLAWPQLERLPPWLFGAVFVLIMAITIRPRVTLALLPYAAMVVPLLLLLHVLRPTRRK